MGIKKGELYRVIDRVPHADRVRLALPDDINLFRATTVGKLAEGQTRVRCMAVWTGEKRKPAADEWFLSGSEPEAYQAENDLTTAYHIAQLVKVIETVSIVRTVVY